MALGNGERYYSPTLARFIQQDSFTGSLNTPQSLNRFSYVHNNPNKYTDPTGHVVETPWDVASLVVGVVSLGYDLYKGDYEAAAVDALGIVADAAAIALPGVPGGAGFAIKAYRAAKVGVKALQYADRAVNTHQAVTAAGDSFGKGNYVDGAINTAFALVGAKGINESAKALGNLDELRSGKAGVKAFDEASDELGSAQKALTADDVKGKGYKSGSDYADGSKGKSIESKTLESFENGRKNTPNNLDFASGRTINGKKASASLIGQFSKEFEGHGITINRKADRILDKNSQDTFKAAAFDFKKKEILLRKGATEYELLHEVEHARHFIELGGREGYEAVGKLAREERVFERLMESKHLFNSYEVGNMQSVIEYYRRTL
jgi:Metallopeptidase toxin 4